MTHSFPTRRSSDLEDRTGWEPAFRGDDRTHFRDLIDILKRASQIHAVPEVDVIEIPSRTRQPRTGMAVLERSEEHTSELQSLMRISYAVFCLKKKTTST